jgi:carbon starvation protein
MNTLPVVLGILCVFALAYRYYSAFLAAKVLVLDDTRVTPAHAFADGHNFHASPKWVLFGHHFAAIAGAGPLVGPTLAAQFGFAPGLLWILVGAVLAGCVQDFTVLVASVRHKGQSIAEIARAEIGPFAGVVALIAVLFILLVTLAGLGLVVVNALAHSAWGVFTIGWTIPIAIGMGLYMFRGGAGGEVRVLGPSLVGVVLLMAALIFGRTFSQSSAAQYLTLEREQITMLMMVYGFVASTLPVWMLLEPRDYLSTYVKLGTIAAMIVGVVVVQPQIRFPAFTEYVSGGGPIIKGKLFPFLFVTIACGAISGFHSLVSSGTTPKMLSRESDARMIGYGAMLCEAIVGVLALIAATSMEPGDYFAINTTPEVFAKLGLSTVHLEHMSREVGEELAGKPGGGVSLAIGMAQIFSGLPMMDKLLGYWFHFAIMFEALFILTTVDTGTRVARYVLQELMGKLHAPLGKQNSRTGNMIATAVVVGSWGYLIFTGSVATIWPLFGTGNQLLATIALAVMTTWLINMGKARYAPYTALPMLFVGVTTLTAGVLSNLDSGLMALFIVGVVLVVAQAARRCLATLRGEPLPPDASGPPGDGPKLTCC